jgi:nucleotide-binding universal stress UspA family protein
MFRRLILALDGSENSLVALDRAIRLAARVDALLDIVSVEEELPRYLTKRDEISQAQTEAERYFAGLQAEATLQAAHHGVRTITRILAGHEVRSLLDYVRDQQADLLVLGARGHSAVWDAFLVDRPAYEQPYQAAS